MANSVIEPIKKHLGGIGCQLQAVGDKVTGKIIADMMCTLQRRADTAVLWKLVHEAKAYIGKNL